MAAKAILFDMDGVLYNAEQPIPGAAEAIHWVNARKIPHLFVTNTTSRGRNVLVEKLRKFGLEASPDKILTPCVAAVEHLKREGGKAALFVSPKARAEFEGIPTVADDAQKGARWVVVGDLGERWDYPTLNRAFRLLKSSPDVVLIALGMTRFWQADDGLRLDAGPFVAALEYAIGRAALVLGKPAAPFFEAAAKKLGVAPGDCVMIGDDILVDVGGAQDAGLLGIQVKTGKYRPGDLDGSVKPDAVIDSVVDLPKWWTVTSIG